MDIHVPRLIVLLWIAAGLANLPARTTAPSPVDGFEPAFAYTRVLEMQPDGKIITESLNRLNIDGSIDRSFDADAFASDGAEIRSIKILPNGKILVAGYFTRMNGVEGNSIARLNSDGTLDTGFNPETSAHDVFYGMDGQPDGRIVLCGVQVSSGLSKALITQLNPDGSLIKRFDPTSDKAVIPGYICSVAAQPDGKVLLGGCFESINGIARAGIARLNPDCTVDTSFNSNLNGTHTVNSIAIQKDGRIAICGNFGVARLNASGSPDPTFIGTVAECVNDVEILPDGKYVLATQTGVRRLLPTGKVDPTFLCGTYFDARCVAIQANGQVLTGGSLNVSRSSTKYFMRLNENGSRDATFNPNLSPNDWVFDIIMQADGKALISGNFTRVNGIPEKYLARLNADGTLDTEFNIGSGIGFREIQSIVVQSDGKVLLGGFFQNVNGVTRKGIARLNDDGSVDISFNPVPNGYVSALATQSDGKILAGGSFSTVNGIPRNGIARLNADGSLDGTFVPSIAASGIIAPIVAQLDGKVLLGRLTLTGKHELIRLNANGSVDPQFQSGLDTNVYIFKILEEPDGKLLIAGDFGLTRLNDDGTTDTTFNATALTNTWIQNIALQTDGKILAAGQDIVRLNPDGSLDTTFKTESGPGKIDKYYWGEPSSTVLALAVKADGRILAGGKFQYFDGTPCNYIVELNSDGSVDRSSQYLSTGTNSPVRALATQLDGNVLIGGEFTSTNGLGCKYIARLNGDTGSLDPRFGSSTDGAVNAVATQTDGSMIIGGTFTTVNGSARGRIARLDSNGSLDTSYSLAGANDEVNAIASKPNGNIVLAGKFTRVSNNLCNHIAELDTNGSIVNEFGSGANGEVNTIAIQPDGKIVLGGDFAIVRANPRNRIARLNANGLIDHAFAPAGANGPVHAILIQPDGKILLGGDFTGINGAIMNRIARLNPDGSHDTSFDPGCGANGSILSMALQADGKIQITGEFTTYNRVNHNHIARLNADGSLDISYDPESGANDNVLGLAIQSDGKSLICGDFTSIKGYARRHIARLSNPDMALSAMQTDRDGGVTWSLRGSAPQLYQAFFDQSADGYSWEPLGWGIPVAGVGYRLPANIPIGGQYVRATGWVSGGRYNGSVSLIRSPVYFTETSRLNATQNWLAYR